VRAALLVNVGNRPVMLNRRPADMTTTTVHVSATDLELNGSYERATGGLFARLDPLRSSTDPNRRVVTSPSAEEGIADSPPLFFRREDLATSPHAG
jgi:hypothetical protein